MFSLRRIPCFLSLAGLCFSPSLFAAGVYVTNSGSITTSADHAHGLESTGDDSEIINSGSITTTGQIAYGIYSTGANAAISSSGSITTSAYYGMGIESAGASATISNSGSITTSGQDAYGINSTVSGANATISNSGSIITSGLRAIGISAAAIDATIGNSGSIITSGKSAHGIKVLNANATVNNSGSIATSGESAHGINANSAFAANATINNSGSISVTGANSVGIYSTGPDGTINLSGLVSATGAATQAIAGGSNQTLNLLPGAAVIGTIDLGSGTNHVNVVLDSGSPSATMNISHSGTITQSGKGLSLVNGSTVSLVDTTHLTANQASLGVASSTIFQAVSQQLNRGASAPQPVKVAASELTPGLLYQEPGPTAWGHAFGGETRRDGSGAALGYKDSGYGLIGGYEQTLGEHRVGVFGGVSRSTVKTTTASIETDGDGAFLGVYGQYKNDDWRLNGALAAGYVSNSSARSVVDNLSGYETAKSDYHSTYLSPSLALIRIFEMGAGVSLRPSAQLNYTYGWVSGYDETGTTRSNLSVGSYQASVLNSRVQLAVRQDLADHQGGFEVRAGASQSDYGDDKVKISLQGASANYAITGTNRLSGGYFGAGGRLALKSQFSLVGDVEYTQGSGDNHAVVGYLGMEYRY